MMSPTTVQVLTVFLKETWRWEMMYRMGEVDTVVQIKREDEYSEIWV